MRNEAALSIRYDEVVLITGEPLKMSLISFVLNYAILISLFVEIATPVSLPIRTAATLTLLFVAVVGALKGWFVRGEDGLGYEYGAFVSSLAFVASGVWLKRSLDHPLKDAPPWGEFLITISLSDVLHALIAVVVVSVVASAGVQIGSRLRQRR